MDLQKIATILSHVLREYYGSVSQGLKECGLKKNVIDNIKNGSTPSIDKIIVIAENVGISTDYLLGLVDEPNPTLPRSIPVNGNPLHGLPQQMKPERAFAQSGGVMDTAGFPAESRKIAQAYEAADENTREAVKSVLRIKGKL